MTHRIRHRAFTLIELLVVIGVLVLLIAILLPALAKVMSSARKTRGAADIGAVSTALDAYKLDFNDFPRPAANNTGFAELGRALVGPGGTGQSCPPFTSKTYGAGDVAFTGSGTSYQEFVFFTGPNAELKYEMNPPPAPAAGPNWAGIAYSDGKPGPGLKVRSGGQSFGPYLDPAKFKTRGLALLDGNDNPILYFRARPGKVAQNPTGWALVVPGGGGGAVYDSNQNIVFFRRPNDTDDARAAERMHALLISNTTDFDGTVEGNQNESAVTTREYLLWAAGEDGVFGAGKPDATGTPTADAVKNCDDVTNFRQ